MYKMPNEITESQLQEMMKRTPGFSLLDVREVGPYDAGHIPGATSLPRRHLEFRIAQLIPSGQVPIILYDDGDGIADACARSLLQFGYSNISVLSGGMQSWVRAGLPLDERSNSLGKAFGERVLDEDAVPSTPVETLLDWRENGITHQVIDIRPLDEHEQGHVPGARNFPGFEVLKAAVSDIDPSQPVVLHCGGRTRGIIATSTLRHLGFDNVTVLENGTMAWLLHDLELERGRSDSLDLSSENGPNAATKKSVLVDRVFDLAQEVGVDLISASDLSQMMNSTDESVVYVIDVRTSAEFESGHIPGSQWVPGGQAVQAADDVIAVRDAPIVFVSTDGTRSAVTAYWFKRMGFSQVSVLDGGIPGWIANSLPIEEGNSISIPLGLSEAEDLVEFVTPSALHATLAGDTGARKIIDVDTSRSFCKGHVREAVWSPRARLEMTIETLAERDERVVVTCRDGVASTLAGATLRSMGYSDVAVLRGGKEAWQRDGYDLETLDPRELSPADDVVERAPFVATKEAMQAYIDWEIDLTEDPDPEADELRGPSSDCV
jgi:rhodanese-related sulfurtransferase